LGSSENCFELYVLINDDFTNLTNSADVGVHFAASVSDAYQKAQASEVLLTCRVKLGNVKTLSRISPRVTFNSLFDEGYDSVLLIGKSTGSEHVVFNSDQVQILESKQSASGKILYTTVAYDGNQNNARLRGSQRSLRSQSAASIGYGTRSRKSQVSHYDELLSSIIVLLKDENNQSFSVKLLMLSTTELKADMSAHLAPDRDLLHPHCGLQDCSA
jgi:hypothetical protein